MADSLLGSGDAGQGGTPPPAATGNPPAGGTGGETKTWRDTLPEDIRSHAAISSFKDVESLTKSYIHAQGLVGKKGAIVPGEKATPEEWNNFYQQLGVPTVDKYDLAMPKDYKMPEPVVAKFKEAFAKNGVLPKQAAAIIETYAQFEGESVKASQAAKEAEFKTASDSLKKEWGDQFDTNLQAANFFLKEKGGQGAREYLEQKGLAADPMVVKLLAEAGKLMGEDKLREGGIGSDKQNPHEIMGEIARIQAEGKTNGFYDNTHPMHATIMRKWESLHKQLTGGR